MCVLDFKPLRASDFPIGNKNDGLKSMKESDFNAQLNLSGREQKILLLL